MVMNVIEVVDVPQGASEDEARRLLNRPCEANRYMLVQVLPLPGGCTRAFYRLVARAYDKKPGERAELGGFKADLDGMDGAARVYIKARMGLPIRVLVEGLADMGITRKKTWVSDAKLALRGSGSKHAEVVLSSKRGGFKADIDGKDDAAHVYVKNNVDLTVAKLVEGLAGLGIDRKKTWVTDARLAARGCGSKHTE
jgi:hypothetical protein